MFDDGGGRLGPLTDLRASFEVRTGALTTVERWRRALAAGGRRIEGVWGREEIAGLVSERGEWRCNDEGVFEAARGDGGVVGGGGDWLLVNGRCVVPPGGVKGWEGLAAGEALTVGRGDGTGAVVVARLEGGAARGFLGKFLLPEGVRTREVADAAMLERPWDVMRYRDAALEMDLELLGREIPAIAAAAGVTVFGAGLRAAKGSKVYAGAIMDCEGGSIVLDEGAVVRPGAIVCGPAYIGKGTTVLERAHIKGHCAIGPLCKVGGEVGGTLFQGYANKAHEGHLGDSWVGEWANLGAGTTNSNLLNTYGMAAAAAGPEWSRERTGMVFLGCVVGDHVKCAIMTRIMTGTVIGTGSMIASVTAPTVVGRFEWVTEGGRQGYRLEKFLEVARAMMGRRKMAVTGALEARLAALHAQSGSGAVS